MNKELANYLESKNGLNSLMLNLKEKYVSLNRYSGSIILKNITQEEANSLSDLLGKTFKEQDNVKTSFKEIEKKINETRFRSFDWEELFKCYFKENIISKKVSKELINSSFQSFLSQMINNINNHKYIAKLQMITNKDCLLYSYLKKIYNQDKKELQINLNNILNLLNNLPKEPLNLTLFASLTGNPHYLDFNTNTFSIFIKILCFIFDEDIPRNNDEKIDLLAQHNLYVDSFSNFVITYNLSGCKLLDIFKENKQIFNINLSNVLMLNNIDTDKKCVYVLENPSLLNVLKELDVSIIITSGMPNMTLYQILDKLINNGNTVYYNGDFDPEGLIIAQKLRKRYSRLQLFCYNNSDYIACKSYEKINYRRLSKLENIRIKELDNIKKLLLSNKLSGYQENNIESIKEYIINNM